MFLSKAIAGIKTGMMGNGYFLKEQQMVLTVMECNLAISFVNV